MSEDLNTFLDEQQAIADAANEGPWTLIGGNEYVTPVGIDVAPDEGGVRLVDAIFIAHSRTAVPRLIEIARTQQAEIEQLRAMLGDLVDDLEMHADGNPGDGCWVLHKRWKARVEHGLPEAGE